MGELRKAIEEILSAEFWEAYQSSGLVTSDEQIEEITNRIMGAVEIYQGQSVERMEPVESFTTTAKIKSIKAGEIRVPHPDEVTQA
jgi:hypothetical protein